MKKIMVFLLGFILIGAIYADRIGPLLSVYPSFKLKPVHKKIAQKTPEQERTRTRVILFQKYPWMTKKLFRLIYREAQKKSLSPLLVAAVIDKESEGKINAHGRYVCTNLMHHDSSLYQWCGRAIGLMQVMPFKYKGKPNNLLRPEINIPIGVGILKECADKFEGTTEILRCYNAGSNGRYNWPYIKHIRKNFEEGKRALVMMENN